MLEVTEKPLTNKQLMIFCIVNLVISLVALILSIVAIVEVKTQEPKVVEKPVYISETTTEVVSTTKVPTTTEVITTEVETEVTTAETEVTTTEKSTAEAETIKEVANTTTETVKSESGDESFIGTFSRGTFYTTGTYGGSGRTLKSGYSIASRALYEKYGYGDYKVRIECDEFPELNGVYSLDDCSGPGNYEVIDFWFEPGEVPAYFRNRGVLTVRAYIVK